MQLQFHNKPVSGLGKIKEEIQYQEQTQELRLPDEMPDVARVLGAWGQVLIRGKEWRNGSMNVTGGVMAWAMYMPEEGNTPYMVEAWIPFQMKWDLPQTQRDGTIRVLPLLRSIDARSTSARKMMLRACVGVLAEATVPMEAEVYSPDGLPEGVELLQHTYPLDILRESGEKPFSLDEELVLPGSAPGMEKLLRFSLQPELIDQKVMADKVVFRGMGIVHILYLGEDGRLHTWDFEVPFSQYTDLDKEYAQDASAMIWLAVTALELDADPEGRMHLKAGLTGQYSVCDRVMITIVEDAYGIECKVVPQLQTLSLPVVLEQRQQSIHSQPELPANGSQWIDFASYPDHPHLRRNGSVVEGEISGCCQVLGYDEDGRLEGSLLRWNELLEIPASEQSNVTMYAQPSGVPSGLGADTLVEILTMSSQGIPMVTDLQVEDCPADPQRPSLILRRAGNDSIWKLAKDSGSTVKDIRQANGFEADPEAGKFILIPVK